MNNKRKTKSKKKYHPGHKFKTEHGIIYLREIRAVTKTTKKVLLQCHCNKIFRGRILDLVKGNRVSCGCMSRNKKPQQSVDYRLLQENTYFITDRGVITLTERLSDTIAEFTCFCGDKFTLPIRLIANGNNKSCGCIYRHNKGKIFKNIYGQDIELLRRISPGKAVFKCHCGKEFVCNPFEVSTKYTNSCGCQGTRERKYRKNTPEIVQGITRDTTS